HCLTGCTLLDLVLVAGTLAHHLAGSGDPEALLGTGVRLVLRYRFLYIYIARHSQPASVASPDSFFSALRRRLFCPRASDFFLFGPMTIVMFRPSSLGLLSTCPSSSTSSARRSSRRMPISGRD